MRGLAPEVGKSSDRWAAESIVRLKAKERAGTIQGNELAQLTLLYGRFGLTPADRAKINVEVPKENRLQKFLERRNSRPRAASFQVLDEHNISESAATRDDELVGR